MAAKRRPILRGDVVHITGEHPNAGETGLVIEIRRANRDYERRAVVMIHEAFRPMIAMRYLEAAEEEK